MTPIRDHVDLAAFARQRAERARGEAPTRIYGALAKLWQAIVALEPLPRVLATRHEIRDQLGADARTASGIVRQGLEALLYYHQSPNPQAFDTPLIVMVHDINLRMRAAPVAGQDG